MTLLKSEYNYIAIVMYSFYLVEFLATLEDECYRYLIRNCKEIDRFFYVSTSKDCV